MRVRAHGVRQALGDQGERAPAGLEPVAAGDRLRVQLCQRPAGKLPAQALGSAQDGVRAALGMGDHDAEPVITKLLGGGVEVLVHRLEGHLDQDPPCLRGTLGDRVHLAMGEPAHHVVPELASAKESHRHARGARCALQLPDPLPELRHVRHEVRPHVGRGHDRARAVGRRGAKQSDALLHRLRPVVHTWERMEVKLYPVHGPSLRPERGAGGQGPVTLVLPTCDRPGGARSRAAAHPRP